MPIKLQEQGVSPDTWLVQKLIAVEETLEQWDIIIAGGAVRKAVFREDLGKSDIDVFFTKTGDWTAASVYFSQLAGVTIKKHPNCIGVHIPETHPLASGRPGLGLYVQLICKECYPTMEELLERFDFTACQFAYKNKKFYYTADAYQHFVQGLLNYTDTPPTQNLTRYAKHLRLGLTPTIETFEAFFVTDRTEFKPGHDELDDFAILYDGI